jgi:excisionase family DNA binding protein
MSSACIHRLQDRAGHDVAGPAQGPPPNQLHNLPPVLDLLTAASLLGIGRTTAYELVRTGQWPTPVVRLGRIIRIPTAPLMELLGQGAPQKLPD